MNTQLHLTEEQIAICAEAILDNSYSTLDNSTREHLAHCDQCASEVILVTEVSEDFFMQETRTEKPFRYISLVPTAIAVAAVILIAVFFTFLYQKNEKPEIAQQTEPGLEIENNTQIAIEEKQDIPQIEDIKTPQTQSTPKTTPSQDKVLLASFEPNETLEKLYENYSGTYRTQQLTILTPGILTFNITDSLRWQNKNKETVIIEILNNKGISIFNTQTNSEGIALPGLPKGLFYFKLINEDFDLVYVGKIIHE